MNAVPATSASFDFNVGSDSEEEVPQLVRRSRASRRDPVLGAKGEHLRTPSQSSLPPQRPAPAVPTAGMPSAGGTGERMLEVKDIRLKTQPTGWPMPQRLAPPIPTADTLALQTGDTTLKTQSPSLLEQQRPAPLSTARTRVAEPAGDEFHTPLNSPSELASPTEPSVPFSPSSLSSLSVATSPASLTSPSWPATPEAGSPVRPPLDTKGKDSQPTTPPSAKATTSVAPPVDIAPASPTEALRHPAGELANLFAENLDQLWALKVPRLPPFMDRNALFNFNQFLGRHEHLLDKKALREAQDCLRNVLANGVHGGVLPGVSEARLQDLQSLSEVNLVKLSQPLRQLDADFAKIYDDVVNWQGGDPGLFTRRERPLAEIQAERDRQLAEDNAAIAARQYPFH